MGEEIKERIREQREVIGEEIRRLKKEFRKRELTWEEERRGMIVRIEKIEKNREL